MIILGLNCFGKRAFRLRRVSIEPHNRPFFGIQHVAEIKGNDSISSWYKSAQKYTSCTRTPGSSSLSIQQRVNNMSIYFTQGLKRAQESQDSRGWGGSFST